MPFTEIEQTPVKPKPEDEEDITITTGGHSEKGSCTRAVTVAIILVSVIIFASVVAYGVGYLSLLHP